jgi:hypothetical protein
MPKPIRPIPGGLAIAVALAVAPAWAETLSFKADLTGSSEVPPVNTAASGTLTATYDTTAKKLSWNGILSGVSGPLVAAHFHGPAEPGQNAGVLIPAPGVSPGAFEGSAVLNDAQAKALMAGQTYFNVHTSGSPNGEFRGQVVRTD